LAVECRRIIGLGVELKENLHGNCRTNRSESPEFQESPGPRTAEGKAVSRYNALKSGLDAQSMVIPGESAEELERLVENYRREHRQASPTEQFLVDAMVAADWQLRRLRAIEAELWKQEGLAAGGFAEAYTLDRAFSRLHRRMDAAERSMYKALKELQKMRKGKEEDEAEEAIPELGSLCAGQNRHGVENERVSQERRQRLHPDPESCVASREAAIEA
jgi:hypothetical protein